MGRWIVCKNNDDLTVLGEFLCLDTVDNNKFVVYIDRDGGLQWEGVSKIKLKRIQTAPALPKSYLHPLARS